MFLHPQKVSKAILSPYVCECVFERRGGGGLNASTGCTMRMLVLWISWPWNALPPLFVSFVTSMVHMQRRSRRGAQQDGKSRPEQCNVRCSNTRGPILWFHKKTICSVAQTKYVTVIRSSHKIILNNVNEHLTIRSLTSRLTKRQIQCDYYKDDSMSWDKTAGSFCDPLQRAK